MTPPGAPLVPRSGVTKISIRLMKKIMFSDKYGLTQAVLNGKKTQTRRVITNDVALCHACTRYESLAIYYANYSVGEVVAVAMSYDDLYMEKIAPCDEKYRWNAYNKGFNHKHKGWKNKMFVSSEDMPHHIRITNIRVEKLQDISDEDCLNEGVSRCEKEWGYFVHDDQGGLSFYSFDTVRAAFAALIDRVSGKDTWDSNPWVFVYDFELVD